MSLTSTSTTGTSLDPPSVARRELNRSHNEQLRRRTHSLRIPPLGKSNGSVSVSTATDAKPEEVLSRSHSSAESYLSGKFEGFTVTDGESGSHSTEELSGAALHTNDQHASAKRGSDTSRINTSQTYTSHSQDTISPNTRSWYEFDLSVLVALVSPIGNWLTGGDHVKHLLLILLLVFYLHQIIESMFSCSSSTYVNNNISSSSLGTLP